jgi:uncharacterized membrane protein YeaQ/YmgE (transglycosylase-associated protein family)
MVPRGAGAFDRLGVEGETVHLLWIILSWLVVGLIVGLIARLLVLGWQRVGFVRTILLGIGGAFLGGLIHWAIYRNPGEPFSFSENAWAGWLFSIGGAVILVLLFSWWQRRRSGWRRWW